MTLSKNVRLEAETAWANSSRSVEDIAQEFDLGMNRLLRWMAFDAVYRTRDDDTVEMPADLHYLDMEARVKSAAPCPVKYEPNPGCWPYGTLFIDHTGLVFFGDLVIKATRSQMMHLATLATGA